MTSNGQPDTLESLACSLRDKLAEFMIEKGFTTGHGDTFDDLLKELSWQMDEFLAR